MKDERKVREKIPTREPWLYNKPDCLITMSHVMHPDLRSAVGSRSFCASSDASIAFLHIENTSSTKHWEPVVTEAPPLPTVRCTYLCLLKSRRQWGVTRYLLTQSKAKGSKCLTMGSLENQYKMNVRVSSCNVEGRVCYMRLFHGSLHNTTRGHPELSIAQVSKLTFKRKLRSYCRKERLLTVCIQKRSDLME